VQGGCRHFGDVLAAEWKIDKHAGRRCLPSFVSKFENGMSDAALGVFRREFPQALRRFLQSPTDHSHGIACKHRMPSDQTSGRLGSSHSIASQTGWLLYEHR
jgi:hypothetical protein